MESISWSQQTTFADCERKWELNYVAGLELQPSSEKKALYRGSAFHAGVAEYLKTGDINKAILSAKDILQELYIPNKTVKDYDNGGRKADTDYYDMLEELRTDVPDALEYYLPNLPVGEGKRYRIATVCDVIGCHEKICDECGGSGEVYVGDEDFDTCEDCEGIGSSCIRHDELMIEYEFNLGNVHGFIDAVLYDTELSRYIIVDWKLRTSFPYTFKVELDGQLQLYATVLNDMGAGIKSAIMWQFKAGIPKPVKLNKDNSISLNNKSTTIERIMSTLPYGWDLMTKDEILEHLGDRLKTHADFEEAVEVPVNEFSMNIAKANTNAVIRRIATARRELEEGVQLPAKVSSFHCNFCDFSRLCATAFTHGVNPDEIIEEYYQPREERPMKFRA